MNPLPKLRVAGSNPVTRSFTLSFCFRDFIWIHSLILIFLSCIQRILVGLIWKVILVRCGIPSTIGFFLIN